MAVVKTLHSIQLLRAAAALLVVLFHGHQAFASGAREPVSEGEIYVFSFGAVGVHLFFVISGFIMVHTMRPEQFSSWAFLRRRILRIYPIYWICAAFYIVAYALLGHTFDRGALNLLGALLLVPGNASDIIGPAWTLSFEMYFYIAFALFIPLGLARGLAAMTIFFLVSIIARLTFGWETPILHLVGNSLLLEFAGGTLIGWLAKTKHLPKKGGWAAINLSLVLLVVGLVYGFERIPGVIVWGIPCILLVFGVVQVEQQSSVSAVVRRLGTLGDASYALYLIHILVITLLLEWAGGTGARDEIPPIAAALGCAVVASLTAVVMHLKIERPMLRALNPRRPLVPQRQSA